MILVLAPLFALSMGGLAALVVAFVQRTAPQLTQMTKPQRKGDRRRGQRAAASPLIERAIALTANLAERQGILGRTERTLRSADIPLRPAELLFFHAAAAVIAGPLVFVVTRSPFLALGAFVFVVLAVPVVLKVLVKRRLKKFQGQLPDTLTALAGSLRAGRSVGQAIEALCREIADPMGRELRKVVAESRLGRPLSESLGDAAERVGSADFEWAVMAMQIQSEVGGNLAELLDQVAKTMRSREQLRGEVKALTAEGRASAMMLVIMPPALGVVMYVVNKDYMSLMLTTTVGHIMLAVSALMIVGGYFWMKKVVTVDV
jgi:tight adherence protein B